MKDVIIIDNYDSFTYNLAHAVKEITGVPPTVKKNNAITLEELDQYEYFILSPGPGLPDEAGLLKPIINHYKGKNKILGVCLGLQAIAEVYETPLTKLDRVFHGIQSEISITKRDSKLFDGVPDKFKAGRYHSWIINESLLNGALEVTSIDVENKIMSIEDTENHIYGLQFHPESIMTPLGNKILENFLSL